MSPGRPAEPQDRPARVRVTSSRRDAATRRDFRPLTREIDEQTDLGEVYMAGLMSAQLRLALRVLAFGAVGLGGLPLLFLLVPDTRTLEIGSLPSTSARMVLYVAYTGWSRPPKPLSGWAQCRSTPLLTPGAGVP